MRGWNKRRGERINRIPLLPIQIAQMHGFSCCICIQKYLRAFFIVQLAKRTNAGSFGAKCKCLLVFLLSTTGKQLFH